MHKVLIANRGEIARRIARSCRTLGLKTVAIYSDADAGAAHVEDADEAYPVGPAAARESYLDAAKILAVAGQAGADAVHPGYGFLSEDADFAQAVVAAGLTWIGPAPAVIRAMGDKQRAREIAVSAGVPVVPGSRRFSPGGIDGIGSAAAAVGYPLLVKAVAGGGGIGMRRVDAPEKLLEAVCATQGMAAKSFGEGAVFLERLIPKARHIEVQVFGFGNGDAVHLYERDCSLQRRFQKVIEESPAPGLPEQVRQDMANVAVRLAQAVRYGSAGTVEFIVDAATFAFFFLEMNTRIQVEHPVTEATTGLDVVGMQIEFARGALSRMPPVQCAAMRSSAGSTLKIRPKCSCPHRDGWRCFRLQPTTSISGSMQATAPVTSSVSITIRCWRKSSPGARPATWHGDGRSRRWPILTSRASRPTGIF